MGEQFTGFFTAQVLPRFMQIIMGESETTFGSKLLEELDDGADVACWGVATCLILSKAYTYACSMPLLVKNEE